VQRSRASRKRSSSFQVPPQAARTLAWSAGGMARKVRRCMHASSAAISVSPRDVSGWNPAGARKNLHVACMPQLT